MSRQSYQAGHKNSSIDAISQKYNEDDSCDEIVKVNQNYISLLFQTQ